MIATIAIRSALSVVLFMIGVYLFVCAVRVKGSIYMNKPLQNTKFYDKYVKMVRGFAFAISGVFLVNLVINIISYCFQYQYLSAYMRNELDGIDTLMLKAEKVYNIATISLVMSIAVVVIMLFTTAYITSAYSGRLNAEKLSEAAFKKDDEA